MRFVDEFRDPELAAVLSREITSLPRVMPAMIIRTSPPTSTTVIRPAKETECTVATQATAPIANTTPVMIQTAGTGTNTAI